MLHPIITPIISIAAGILVLIFPTVLNYIVGIYLILMGLVGIFGRM
ncbi:MAG: DUF3096 domain-containing protein [Simkaniaceae bacterium]|nr:DUF3096 domain-containing protein [Candidatus Sacchlamyda saccharinae]